MTTGTAVALCAALPLPAATGGREAPKHIHLLPAGEIRTADGRGPYRVRDPQALIRASMEGGRLVLDENHATDLAAPRGDSAPARGWIVALQSRADGIWGEIEWTEIGRQLVAEKAYRNISPAIRHLPDGTVTGVLRASLVNLPNLRGLTALHQQGKLMDLMTNLRTMLGLPEDAGEAAVLASVGEALTARHSAGTPDPAKFVPIGDYTRLAQELHRVHQGVELQAAKQYVEEAFRKGHLLGFQKDWAIQLCSVNKPAFDKYCEQTGARMASILLGSGGASRTPPPFAGRSNLDGAEAEVASKLGLTPEQFHGAGGK